MTQPLLLGTIVEKDGMLCLQSRAICWYPLNGPSDIAECFRESFNAPQRSDTGKRLYNSGGVLQMENNAQKLERETRENLQ